MNEFNYPVAKVARRHNKYGNVYAVDIFILAAGCSKDRLEAAVDPINNSFKLVVKAHSPELAESDEIVDCSGDIVFDEATYNCECSEDFDLNKIEITCADGLIKVRIPIKKVDPNKNFRKVVIK